MNKNLKNKLENMKPIKMSSADRQVLWSKIEGGIDAIEKGHVRSGLSMGTRFAVASLAVLVVLSTGSFATISAANASGPGDALFGIDLAVERLQLLISRHDRRDELRLRFAEERLGEVYDALELADLDGLDLQLALASTSTDDTATSTDDTATSTDETATSTDETATSTDDTATSTDDTATSTDDDESDGEQEDRIIRAQLALEVALDRLETARDELEAEGNDVAVAAINQVIDRLQAVAEDYINQLDRIRAKLKDGNNGFKFELKTSSDDLRIKFRLRINDGDNDGETDIRIKENDDKSSIKLRSGDLRLEFKENTSEDKDNEHDDNSDRDGDRDREDRSDRDNRFDFLGDRVEICHKGKTIEVSSFSKYAHILHGDKLGQCNDSKDDNDIYEDDHNDDNDDGHYYEDEHDEDDGDEHDDDDEDINDDSNDGGDNSTTTTDIIAPIISGISATTTTSTADISWITDEASDSTIWYGTSTPIVVGSGGSESSATLTTDHSLSLTGLTASTTYYYVVESTDDAVNTATSSEESFLTL